MPILGCGTGPTFDVGIRCTVNSSSRKVFFFFPSSLIIKIEGSVNFNDAILVLSLDVGFKF